jgi:1-hydroxycarotenoid 3,4-desaturase
VGDAVARERIVIVGAGMGGLAAAVDLARRGAEVIVCDRARTPGGKMRQLPVGGGALVDAGPTVFTMRWVFENLFADAGECLTDHLSLSPAGILARHAWRQGGRLDLFADKARSADAIAAFAGPADARGFLEFCDRSASIYRTLEAPFIASERPSLVDLMLRVGVRGLPALSRTESLPTLWNALGRYFRDPRLRQLFARYATYVGSSPFLAPATLMLIAHVEQDGVWLVEGGIHRVAQAVRALAERKGATFRFGAEIGEIIVSGGRVCGVTLAGGERLAADAVVFNGDISALPAHLRPLPPMAREERSLSAVTWCLSARTQGFPLAHHNVFFAEDYAEEFQAIFNRRAIAAAPTVYLCAQDRGRPGGDPQDVAERLFALVNAPADGDAAPLSADAIDDLERRAFGLLNACGLDIDRTQAGSVVTTPADFNALYPATGGALYGRVNHGPQGSFGRAGAAGRMPGLYLAGGSVHPGPGIPMAALSGRLAAARLLEDRARAGGRTRTVSIPIRR